MLRDYNKLIGKYIWIWSEFSTFVFLICFNLFVSLQFSQYYYYFYDYYSKHLARYQTVYQESTIDHYGLRSFESTWKQRYRKFYNGLILSVCIFVCFPQNLMNTLDIIHVPSCLTFFSLQLISLRLALFLSWCQPNNSRPLFLFFSLSTPSFSLS